MKLLGRLLAVAGIVFAVACGGNTDSDSPTKVATPVPAQEEATGGPPVFGTPVWAAAVDRETNEPVATVTAFPATAKELVVAIPVEKLPEGTRLEAKWFYNDTSLDAFTTQISVDHDTGSSWVEFTLSRTTSAPWPEGEYVVEFYAGTEKIGQTSIRIEST